MFNPSRDQARDFFFETWRKYRAQQALAGLETVALQVILAHPEYQAALDDPERYRELSIDQPPGIASAFAALAVKRGERHAAMHDAMECLGEMVWRSQRDRAPPDGAEYLECLKKRAR